LPPERGPDDLDDDAPHWIVDRGAAHAASRTGRSSARPAHRGEEVTAAVLDGPASIAFTQARNKLNSAMAALEWCRR
jgi:ornithine carbamoyltransferase